MTSRLRLIDTASVIRSKNAGPFLQTIDIIFRDQDAFDIARQSPEFDADHMATLLAAQVEETRVIWYPIVSAVKITVPRPHPAGAVHDSDVYGTQQYIQFLDLEFGVPEQEQAK